MNQAIKAKLTQVPRDPGVYLIKDANAQVIYVGKAKSLRNRLASYFGEHKSLAFKTQSLVREAHDFDIMIVRTEQEALLSERNLIREYQPRFNILLRDDKEYPYLRVDLKERWPRLEKVRRRKDDGATYLGPFGSASQLSLALKAVQRVFPLIRCSRYEFEHAKRPCNYYHMKQCQAPCALSVDPDGYKEMVKHAIAMLNGNSREAITRLKSAMQKAAELKHFEVAAQVRDQYFALQKLLERQSTVIDAFEEADVLCFAQQDAHMVMQLLMIRGGHLLGQEHFVLEHDFAPDQESMQSALSQYYHHRYLPEVVVLCNDTEDLSEFEEHLKTIAQSQGRKSSIKVLIQSKNQHILDLIKMCRRNAAYQLEEAQRRRQAPQARLEHLRNCLQLKRLPKRMECMDISNLGGTAIVASNVVFIEGKAAKDLYRIYNIQSVSDQADDYQSMREVVERRLKRADRDGDLPDLLLIDGGKGQLAAAESVKQQFPHLEFDLRSIAKSHLLSTGNDLPSEMMHRSDERIFMPGSTEPYILSPSSVEYQLLTSIRDEAHRFAITRHRHRRQRLAEHSDLLSIQGLGPKLKSQLLQTFGSIDAIKSASLEQLRSVPGISQRLATTIHAWSQAEADESAVTALPPQKQQEDS